MQALLDWLYKVEPQLAEDQPVHGDRETVISLIEEHKVKEQRVNYYFMIDPTKLYL